MNYVLVAQMDQVFRKTAKHKKYWKMEKILEKSRIFFQSGKVGTSVA